MKKYTIYIKYFSLSTLLLWSCDKEDKLIEERIEENSISITYTSGEADFSNFVSMGNSLVAGFMDGALYTEGQSSSFANIIGQQIVKAELSTSFNQPDIDAVNGFNTTLNSDNTATFGKFILNTAIPGPEPTTPGDEITAYSGDKSQLNNFGVPGLNMATADNAGLYQNPFYARFATDPGTSTLLNDVISVKPTFFILWVGSNDVLNYALDGGTSDAPLDKLDAQTFQSLYTNIITKLRSTGAQGIIINLPPILTLPYLNAVSYNPIPMTAELATNVNSSYAQYNGGLLQAYNAQLISEEEYNKRIINFKEGNNGFVVEDPELTTVPNLPKLRQTNASDKILLSAGSLLGTLADPENPNTVYGVGTAMNERYVLTSAEQANIVTGRATYSAIINGIAAATPGVEMFDIQPLLANAAGLSQTLATQLALTPEAISASDGIKGFDYEGVVLQPDFSPTGIFSTDGIHPNPRGHAIVANEVISFINGKWGSNIPKVNTTIYRTVLFK